MTHENQHFDQNTLIGPGREQRKRDQERALRRGADQAIEGLNRHRKMEIDLKECYGEDLTDFGRAYFDAGYGGYVVVRGKRTSKDDIRPKFATALTEALESQPPELKGAWLNNYLKDITDFAKV